VAAIGGLVRGRTRIKIVRQQTFLTGKWFAGFPPLLDPLAAGVVAAAPGSSVGRGRGSDVYLFRQETCASTAFPTTPKSPRAI
jgi:hypothetical protein